MRLRNARYPKAKPNSAGTSTIASKVKTPLWKGHQKSGKVLTWFQTMKSGSELWYTLFEPISSIRCMPIAYAPRPKNTPWPSESTPA
jgi:hypothetical protein